MSLEAYWRAAGEQGKLTAVGGERVDRRLRKANGTGGEGFAARWA